MCKVVTFMSGRKKRYWRLRELSRFLDDGNSTKTAIRINKARKSDHVIVTSKHGYTIRPKKEDYIHEMKMRGKMGVGLFTTNQCSLSEGMRVAKDELRLICKDNAEQIMLRLDSITNPTPLLEKQ